MDEIILTDYVNIRKHVFKIFRVRVAIQHLRATGTIKEQDVFEINELCAHLNQAPIAVNDAPELAPAPAADIQDEW